MTLALVQPRMTVSLAQISNEELARRARAGSSASFEELVQRFQTPLLRFLLRRTPARADAEDLVQETFLRAYVSLPQYSDRWPIRTWLFTIAHRLAINHTRRLSARPAIKLAVDPSEGKESPATAAARADDAQSLWHVARTLLPEDQFTALWLYYVEELPPAQITKVLDRSWIAVKTMLHRARRRLLPHLRHLDERKTPRRRP